MQLSASLTSEVLNQAENVEQFERKRHTEMDNISVVAAWTESVKNLPGKLLDSDKPLDILKYVALMGDPRKPREVPPWLEELFSKIKAGSAKSATFAAKMSAITNKMVTKQWLNSKKVSLLHPQIKGYADLALRHRFLRGFCPEALQRLRDRIVIPMGQKGLASKPFPISRAVLMDSNILTSDAFSTLKEKEDVPSWRDGAAGRSLQLRMAETAGTRYWEYDFHQASDQKASIFASGATWAGFTRLIGHIEAAMEGALGTRSSWPDSAACALREIWRGEHDQELARLAAQLPSNLDNTPTQMHSHLKDRPHTCSLPGQRCPLRGQRCPRPPWRRTVNTTFRSGDVRARGPCLPHVGGAAERADGDI